MVYICGVVRGCGYRYKQVKKKGVNNMVEEVLSWLWESNRWKHLVGVMLVSMVGTLLMGIGCIGGMEFKDVHHANGDAVSLREWDWSAWDWLDVLSGLIGGIVGQMLQVVFLWVLWRIFL